MTAATTTLTGFCGHHCGTQNGRTAHCWCWDCHDGEPGYSNVQADGCEERFTLDGRSTGGMVSETHEPGSHIEFPA